MKKSDREIMEILEAFDATGCAHSAAPLAGVDPKTVRRYVAKRDAGEPVDEPVRRPKLIDPFLAKIEELVETSEGEVRADVVHERLVAMGFTGDERTTRRAVAHGQGGVAGRASAPVPAVDHRAGAVAAVRLGRRADRVRARRPAAADVAVLRVAGVVAVPGGDPDLGPHAGHAAGLPGRDAAPARWGTDLCVDRQREDRHRRARRRGPGAPPEDRRRRPALRLHGAHLCPVRPRVQGRVGGHGADRQGRPGARPRRTCCTGYNSFAELAEACEAFCDKVNARVHRETNRIPAEALLVEQARLHPIPAAPFTAALGETRSGQHRPDDPVRVGALLHPAGPGRPRGVGPRRRRGAGHRRQPNRTARAWSRSPGTGCPRRGTRGSTCRHYPDHPQQPDGSPKPPQPKARNSEEKAFLALGPGAHSWLVEAAAVGAQRVRSKMAAAVELAALVGVEPVDAALGVAAAAGRFAEGDLLAIVHHRANGASIAALVVADEDHSAQPGTSSWASFGTRTELDTDVETREES